MTNLTNVGKVWAIGNLKPATFFDLTDEAQQKECYHFSNLAPVWIDEAGQPDMEKDLKKIDLADKRAKANVERYYTDARYRKQQERIHRRVMGDIEELLGAHLTKS